MLKYIVLVCENLKEYTKYMLKIYSHMHKKALYFYIGNEG